MSDFNYHGEQLFAEDVALSELAERFGTPTYVYSRAGIERNFLSYATALSDIDHLICYAVKANSNIAVLNILARLGAGFDIVSRGELERVVAAGGDPSRVVYSGIAKSRDDISFALQQGIHCFNIESPTELERINEVAAGLGVVAPISVRVNPDVDANTHPYISTGLKENKFGIESDQALAVYRRAAALSHINVVGIDCHIGSQLTEISPLIDALRRLLTLVDQLNSEGISIRHLDLGGGLGVRYKDENPPAISDYLAAVTAELGDRELELLLEPGRSITATAGVLLTRVDSIKETSASRFAIVDAAMNDMIRPALYQAWLDIVPVQRDSGADPHVYDIVGPVCESADFLGKQRELAIRNGDLLAVTGAGAYGFVMSSNYNTRGRAAEIMVDGSNMHTVRDRETVADLMRGESVLPD